MVAKSNFVQPAIPKFDGHYDHWSMLMKNFLHSKEYWSLVETGIPVAAEGVVIICSQSTTKNNCRPEVERLEGQELFVSSH